MIKRILFACFALVLSAPTAWADFAAGTAPQGLISGVTTYTTTQTFDSKAGTATAPYLIHNFNVNNATGACIHVTNSHDVLVTSVALINCSGAAVNFENCEHCGVKSSYFEKDYYGIFAQGGGCNIYTNWINIKNLIQSTGSDTHSVILDHVNPTCVTSGSTRSLIQNIHEIDTPGSSWVEDHLNFYHSSGQSSLHNLAQNNCFQGGGPSTSSTGSIAESSAYWDFANNTMLSSGQNGMSSWSDNPGEAHDNNFWGNIVYSPTKTYSNVGMNAQDTNNDGFPPAAHAASGNKVSWKNSSGVENDWYPDSATNLTFGTAGSFCGANTCSATGLSTLVCTFWPAS